MSARALWEARPTDLTLTSHRQLNRYVGKLRSDLDAFAGEVFAAPSARDRVQSILADLNKTAADFEAIGARAVEQLANGLMPRIRCVDGRRRERYMRRTPQRRAAFLRTHCAGMWICAGMPRAAWRGKGRAGGGQDRT